MNSDKIGKDILENLGFSVEKITESDKKSSDYIATYQNQKFIFEVKLKEDDEDQVKQKDNELKLGKTFTLVNTVGRNETFSGIIKKSARQLKSTSQQYNGFKIVLIICAGNGRNLKVENFFHTLYGSVEMWHTNTKKLTDCYFYNNSDFYRRKKDIDGALIVVLDENKFAFSLCLNNFSSNYDELKESSFLKSLDKKEIIDPVERERNGIAFINDSGKSAKKDEIHSFQTPVLDYISNKYNLGSSPLHPMHWKVAEISVPISAT